MKNRVKLFLVVCTFIISSFTCFSQENNGNIYSHTLQTNISYRYTIGHPAEKLDANSLLNFIPSYELGYKNMFFAKFRYLNCNYFQMNKNDIFFYGREGVNNLKITERLDAFTFTLSYNFLNKSPRHILKTGINIGYYFSTSRTLSIDPFQYNSYYDSIQFTNHLLGFGLECSYKYQISTHFAIGAEIDYAFFNNEIIGKMIGYSLIASYRF